MSDVRLGICLWNQAAEWAELEAAARRVDELGYEHLWTWDHLYAIVGDPYKSVFEGYATLGALAKVTWSVRLGLFVGANTFRNPGLVAKSLTTLDHASGGRIIAGLGAAWHELEHEAHGIDFGSSPGERLRWLEESVGALRGLFAGETVTSPPGGRYEFRDLRLLPPPVQKPIPIMVGGSGEKRTLKLVARHADACNFVGDTARVRHKLAVLHEHCAAEDRDPAAITVTHLAPARVIAAGEPREGQGAATVEEHVGRYRELAEAGVQTAIAGLSDAAGPDSVARFAEVIAAFAPR